jgi:hypothetical protein
MKAKDKWNNTVTFRDVRDAKNAKKLGDMTMAQYNSLKYQENRKMVKNVINEAEIKRRFKNLISTTQLLKKIAQYGYQGNYTEQALYQLLDKYGIKPKTKRRGKSYFNKKNACTCIERHIFELKELAERLSQQNSPQEEPEWNVGYGRNDMSVASRECLANDDVFGADENELYRTDENILNFKSIVNEAIEEDYGQYPMPSIDDIEGEKMTTMYRVAFKNQLDSIFEFGYNRAFTGSKGGNMYGAGVYCTYKLEDSIHNVKTKPEYGDCIVKMFLIGGFDGFITFDEHNARRMYGKFWRIKDQLIHRYGVDSFEAERIERRCSLADGDLYHGRTAPAAYSFVTNCRNLIKEKGIRGVIYKGNRDGHCVVPYDFSAVIPYSVSFDQGKTFKKMFKPETYQRMQDSIDVQFRYGNKYAKVFESVKGFTMVQNRAGKYNFVDNSDDKELSPYWFDEVLSKINPNNGTFGFKFKGHDFIGSIISPQGSSEKGCIMDEGQPYCDFSDLPDLVNAIENGEA